MAQDQFESVLIVFQNPVPGRVEPYDDWYTNIHIRDAMRIEGAIATQRFIVCDDELTIRGRRSVPQHWAHTIYEWESAAKSVDGHRNRVGTPAMEISRDGSFENLRDYFYRPVFLSHGWSRDTGFRRGGDILTAMIVPASGQKAAVIEWFRERHAPAVLALPGFASIGLFAIHEAQSLAIPTRFSMAAVYSLSNRGAALRAFETAQDASGDANLTAKVSEAEITCWQPRTPRLTADEVADPTAEAAAEERRARTAYADRFIPLEEFAKLVELAEEAIG